MDQFLNDVREMAAIIKQEIADRARFHETLLITSTLVNAETDAAIAASAKRRWE